MPSWLAKGKFYLPSMQHCLNGGMAWPIFTTAIAYLWRDAAIECLYGGFLVFHPYSVIHAIDNITSTIHYYFQKLLRMLHIQCNTCLFFFFFSFQNKVSRKIGSTTCHFFKINNFHSNCMLMYKLPCMLRKEKVVVCICDLLIFVNK